MSLNPEYLTQIKTLPSLIRYLRDELDWPIEADDFEELTFDYEPKELGIDTKTAAKIEEIKQLRPLVTNQPWAIFFVKFEPKRLPVIALRRILSRLVIKKRASARKSDLASWSLNDLLFISNYGEGNQRHITFAHFSQDDEMGDLPTLKVLGWDDEDTVLHLEQAHKVLKERLRWPSDPQKVDEWRDQWASIFTLRHKEVITTSKDLAIRLAHLATAIRKRVSTVLSIESENGPLKKLMNAFKQALIHDLYEEAFADMYAQTITYGLLSARVSRPAGLVADNLTDMVPVTNPFLKELLSTFLTLGGRKGKIDFDELGINEVVHALRNANMEAVLRDFGDRNPQEDPVIHFYELFLKEYNPELRMQRGVFYTPRPVVSFIVRSVDETLRREFGLEDGLADTTTWGEMLSRFPEMKLPKDTSLKDPFVQVLDPALGTGTFLVEVVDIIHKTMTAKWQKVGHPSGEQQGLWNEYVPKHLLPRIYGFELLMAPYAIAHMKIGLKLYETGYRFHSEERAHIYLTNSLEPPSDVQMDIPDLLPALAHEAQAVNTIKRRKRFIVVIGNPPYSGHSVNNDILWIVDKVYDYKRGIPELQKPAQAKWLQDDYVKFIRYGQWLIEQTGRGVLAYISNHSFLDNPTFRGMRRQLLEHFQRCFILDLHGNAKKRETCLDGSKDENVFDIQQGVAISILIRRDGSASLVCHGDLYGFREYKYRILAESTNQSVGWKQIHSDPPFFLLMPQDVSTLAEYDSGFKITEAMALYGDPAPGVVTTHDEFAISWTKVETVEKVERLVRTKSEEEARGLYRLCAQAQWNYKQAKHELSKGLWKKEVGPILYRPFDQRWTVYNANVAVHRRLRASRHFIELNNLGLCVGKAGQVVGKGQWNLVFCTRFPVDFNLFYRGGACNLPLYVYPESSGFNIESSTRLNFVSTFTRDLADRMNLTQVNPNGLPEGIMPDHIFEYAYAVFHSPAYRSRYAEFLKIDFPRLPLTSNLELFRNLTRFGGELVALHLMESPKLDEHITKFIGKGDNEVVKVRYEDETVWINSDQGFKGVAEDVWNFHIGGYQVCKKWLKDRKGRHLTKDDIEHYQKIVVALNETICLMAEIDKVIEKHGGWPGAFAIAKA